MTTRQPRRPTSVKVGPQVYAIEYESEHLSEANRAGETNHTQLLILINDTLHVQYQKQTLVHEILHSCFYAASHLFPDGFEKRVKEEEIISGIEGPLFGVLQENPVVMKWVMS